MDRELLREFCKDALNMAREAIRLIKSSGLLNETEMLDFMDELNKLSVDF